MRTQYTIKNFRVFDEAGATIDFKPITILTGCNSSGKSSVSKSIALLNTFFDQIKSLFCIKDYTLDFNRESTNILKSFNNCINFNSESSEISFEYTVDSKLLNGTIRIKLTFISSEKDKGKSGVLKEFIVFTEEGKELLHSQKGEYTIVNFDIIRGKALEFLKLDSYLFEYYKNNSNDIEYYLDTQVDDNKLKNAELFLLKTNWYKEIVEYNNGKRGNKNKIPFFNCPIKVVNWSIDNDSLFYIPLLEKLEGLSKKEVTTELSKLCEILGEGKPLLKKLLNDFQKSNSESIKSYFIKKEHEFFKHIRLDYAKVQFALPVSLAKLYKFTADIDICNSFDIASDDIFPYYYDLLMHLNDIEFHNKKEYKEFYDADINNGYYHNIYFSVSKFLDSLMAELFIPDWSKGITFAEKYSYSVKKFYDANDYKNHVSGLLNKYLEAKQKFAVSINRDNLPNDTFLNRWVKNLGIGESVEIEGSEDGILKLFINKSNRKVSVSDEGWGIMQIIFILIQIETYIYNNNYYLKDDDFKKGLGKGNILAPTASMHYYTKTHIDTFEEIAPTTIFIEEPEVHLHPALQSKLADLFYEAATKYNIHFVIETHSEYLVRRSQVIVAQQNFKSAVLLSKNNPFVVYYMPTNGVPYDMKYQINGKFKNKFDSGFYDIADNLFIDLI